MELVSPQHRPVNSHFGVVTRGSEPGHAFSHLHPVTLILLGLLLVGTSIAAIVQSQQQHLPFLGRQELDHLLLPADSTATPAETTSSLEAAEVSESPAVDPASDTTTSTVSASITIGADIKNASQAETNSSLHINGVPVELPDNGRIRENVQDGETVTRIDAKVDSNNTKLIISTNSSSTMSGD